MTLTVLSSCTTAAFILELEKGDHWVGVVGDSECFDLVTAESYAIYMHDSVLYSAASVNPWRHTDEHAAFPSNPSANQFVGDRQVGLTQVIPPWRSFPSCNENKGVANGLATRVAPCKVHADIQVEFALSFDVSPYHQCIHRALKLTLHVIHPPWLDGCRSKEALRRASIILKLEYLVCLRLFGSRPFPPEACRGGEILLLFDFDHHFLISRVNAVDDTMSPYF